MSVFTKKAIQAAFLSLLERTPLDKITVKMIVDACGISRNTFYYHYEDINALLKDLLETEMDRVQSEIQDGGGWQATVAQVLSAVAAHKQAFYHIFRSADRKQLHLRLRTLTRSLTAQAVDAAGGQSLKPMDRETISVFFSSAFLGICEQWLDEGMKEPPEALIHRLDLFAGMLEQAVERAAKSGH